MPERQCEICGVAFEQKGGRAARWCKPCRPQARRNSAKTWYENNPDKKTSHASRNPEYVRAWRASRPRCTVDCCEGDGVYRGGLCTTHYSRLQRTGSVADPKPRTVRESVVDINGYRKIRVAPGQYKMEHRLVVEQALGRELARHENVHHKNGVRLDNSLSNLEVWVKPQPCGQRPEDLAAWVVEQYPDLVRSALNNEPLRLF